MELKKVYVIMFAVLSLTIQGSAETASNDYISISIDMPEYAEPNEFFDINLSITRESIYPLLSYRLYLYDDLISYSFFYYDGEIWNKTLSIKFLGNVGGVEFYLSGDNVINQGQTVPIKFRAQKVTHTFYYLVKYVPYGSMWGGAIGVPDEVTIEPVYDPSVQVTVSNGTGVVYEAIAGKGVDYIRFSEGNDQYIVNWDTSGYAPGEYTIKVSFESGYSKETGIVLQ